ncbi:MAG: hypothetical protein JXQ87_05875 [Bacteroidia bacterium]
MILSWVFALLVVLNAWVCDDAFISFRTVDNFVNGFGLRYNVVERVQTFTNPLLVIILLPIHAIFKGISQDAIYYESLGLSFLLLGLFLYLLNLLIKSLLNRSIVLFLLCINVPIIDFFTSGLENSINYVLTVIVLLAIVKNKPNSIAFFSGVMVLSRLDLLIFVLPCIAYYAIYEKRNISLFSFLGLFVFPWAAWEVFSLVYYGTPIPNSVIAKVGFDPSFKSVVYNDLNYLFGTYYWYPIAFLMPIVLFLNLDFKKNSQGFFLIGACAYLLFPFLGGGDFMAGRFQTVPTLALIVLSGVNGFKMDFRKVLALLLVVFFVHPNSLIGQFEKTATKGKKNNVFSKVADEKMFYFYNTSLMRKTLKRESISHTWLKLGEIDLGERDMDSVIVWLMAGFKSYCAGSNKYITDKIGLTDPLLSRLPCNEPNEWRPGHATKKYPKGYLETILNTENLIEDEKIRVLYDDILLVTRSEELFTKERWAAIWRLNTGYHKIERGYE